MLRININGLKIDDADAPRTLEALGALISAAAGLVVDISVSQGDATRAVEKPADTEPRIPSDQRARETPNSRATEETGGPASPERDDSHDTGADEFTASALREMAQLYDGKGGYNLIRKRWFLRKDGRKAHPGQLAVKEAIRRYWVKPNGAALNALPVTAPVSTPESELPFEPPVGKTPVAIVSGINLEAQLCAEVLRDNGFEVRVHTSMSDRECRLGIQRLTAKGIGVATLSLSARPGADLYIPLEALSLPHGCVKRSPAQIARMFPNGERAAELRQLLEAQGVAV